MVPIQLWLPTFFGGIARPELRRDMQRLFRARTTEQVMWTVPGWTGPAQWMQQQTRVGCLNGDTLECVRVLHVGENGAVVGPAAASFPKLSVEGLLDAWLNDDFVRAVPRNPNEPLCVKIPHAVNGGVAMVRAEIAPTGEKFLPFTHIADDRAFAQWPPRSDMPTTVSPEMESARLSSDSRNALKLRLAWAAPFNEAQPLVISPDDLVARDRLRFIAATSGDDCANALAQATTEAREWLSEGQASPNEAWLQPIIAGEGEQGALFAIESRFGISADSLEKAYESRELRRRLSTLMPVTRAWGVPGLMWARLLERLSSAQPYRACERCGRLISGRRHKRFCSAQDNSGCYQVRKAGDKRRSRSRAPTRG